MDRQTTNHSRGKPMKAVSRSLLAKATALAVCDLLNQLEEEG